MYINELSTKCLFFRRFFIPSLSHDLPTIRGYRYWEAKGPRDTILSRFQVVFYLRCTFTNQGKRYFFVVLLFGLLPQIICSYGKSERRTPGSGGRRAKPLPLCALIPHTLVVTAMSGPVHSADQLPKPVEVHIGQRCTKVHKGQRGRMDDSITVPSILSHCPKLCFQTCREFSSELFGSVFVLFFFFFLSYFKKVTSKKYWLE